MNVTPLYIMSAFFITCSLCDTTRVKNFTGHPKATKRVQLSLSIVTSYSHGKLY